MPCERDENGVARCTVCHKAFNPYWHYIDDGEDNEPFTVKLCCDCFEVALEEYEEERRGSIALQNEY